MHGPANLAFFIAHVFRQQVRINRIKKISEIEHRQM
jgi:hypothetical protein